MKFGQQLEVNIFPQWSKYYVRYRQIKNYINQLFPTVSELEEEARADTARARQSLRNLTDPNFVRNTSDPKDLAETIPSDDETESLLSGSPSPSPDSASSAPPLRSGNERSALNTNTQDYGGLDRDDPLRPIPARARVDILLNDEPISPSHGITEVQSGLAGTSLSPESSPSPNAPVDIRRAASPSHIGRNISRRAAQNSNFLHSLRGKISPAAHDEKMDQIVVKIMSEVSKVDEFHRLMETKILQTFENLQQQASATQAARAKPPKQEGIMARLRELQKKRSKTGKSASMQMEEKSLKAALAATTATNVVAPESSPSPSNPESPDSDPSSSTHPPHHHSHHLHQHHHHHQHHLKQQTVREEEEEQDEIDAIPLRSAYIQLLRRTTMLIHFVDINYVAFMKLIKVFEKRTIQSLNAMDEQAKRELKHMSNEDAKAHQAMIEAMRTHTTKVMTQLKHNVSHKHFYVSHELDEKVLPTIYSTFADLFEHGNIEQAKLTLLGSMTEQQYNRQDSFWLGTKIGVIAMLILLLGVILIRPVEDLELVAQMSYFAPIYRSIGLLICFLWFWSFLVYIWDKFRIPYVLIFQLNPRTRLTHFQIQTEAANLTIVYLFNSLLFLTHSGTLIFSNFSLMMYPLALFILVLLKFFTPSRLMSHWNSRSMLLATLGQIVIAPFGKIRFMEAFVADILTSMVKIFVDIEASFCILITYFYLNQEESGLDCGSVARVVVPIICALPLWWRFMQCLRRYYDTQQRHPHVANAVKYLITHSVVIMAAYHPIFQDHHSSQWQTYRIIWLLCCIVSTLYNFIWDITQDWGLFVWSAPYPLLRHQLIYTNHIWFYYWAIVSNFFLRGIWVITIIPFSFEEENEDKHFRPTTFFSALVTYDQFIVPLLGILELFRRFQWAVLRVEYEQITQGTHLRVDSHLPVFIQQMQKSSKSSKAEEEDKGSGVVSEVVGMVLVLLIIAVIAAVS